MPIRKPARSGQRRLAMLASSTLRMAIAAAASAVPGNSMAPGATPRRTSPAASTPKATSRTRSSPWRRLSQAAKAEAMPKNSTGVAPSSDNSAVDRCSRDARSGNSGGRLAIAIRRLNPAAAMATMSNAVS